VVPFLSIFFLLEFCGSDVPCDLVWGDVVIQDELQHQPFETRATICVFQLFPWRPKEDDKDAEQIHYCVRAMCVVL
jgi:hypothetical protein